MFRNQQPIDFAPVSQPRAIEATQEAAGKDITNYVIAGLLTGIIAVAVFMQYLIVAKSLF